MYIIVDKTPPPPIKTTITYFKSDFPDILPSGDATECTSTAGTNCRNLPPLKTPWVERSKDGSIKAEHVPCGITGIACLYVANSLQQAIKINLETRHINQTGSKSEKK